MSIDNELQNIDELISALTENQRVTDEQEAIINMEIANLRLKLAKIRDSTFANKQKLKQAYQDRDSLKRKKELEEESLRIQSDIEKRRTRAYELIAEAPWIQDAYPWQIEGALQLPERALLGDKRGMGKTFSALIWRKVQEAKRVLVCVRREVAYDFIKEINYREPGTFVYQLLGASPVERNIAANLLKPFDEFIVVTNIESWRINVDKTTEDLLKLNYDAIILDEAHNVKNYNSATAKGYLKLAQKVPKVLEMTGTPIKNRPQEMFTLLHALYPAIFPTQNKFLFDYCIQMGQNKWAFTPMGLKSLVAKISSFYIARSPEDVGRQVPPPRIIEYRLTMDNHPEQKKAYQSMTERNLAILGTGKVVPIVSQLAVMTRQAQMVSWPAGISFDIKDEEGFVVETVKFDVHQSVKADWAEEFIQELVSEGERVILFSRFKPAIYELKKRLYSAGLSVAVITGDEKGDRREIFDDFDLKTAPENPRFQVLLATYGTVGESANLNAARHAILYDRYWNPGNDDQAIGRIDRINSIDQATIHLPSVEDTIDDFMIDLIDNKRNIVQEFKSAAAQQASLMAHLERTK